VPSAANLRRVHQLSCGTQSLARQQHGLLTIRQLADDGFRSRRVNRLIEQGYWARVSSVVVAVHSQPLTRVGRLWAASLHYERCGLGGPSVLELFTMPQPHDGHIHVVGSRAGRTSPMPGCVQHTSIDCRLTDAGPLRVSIDLAVLQALGWAHSDRQAVFYATWAIQRGLVELEGLYAVADPFLKSRPGKLARMRLSLIKPGVHSVNEFDFARECTRRGLPEPMRQRQRRDASGKLRYTDVEFRLGSRNLVVEIDGLGHLDTSVRVDDQFRANELTLQGDVVVRIPAVALRTDPEPFFQQIARALNSHN
jgi:hypothetical protein